MRLNWLCHYETIDNRNLQEEFIEIEQGLRKIGRKITFCDKCKRWVPKYDYDRFCNKGFCEFSEEVVPANSLELQEIE